MYPVCSRQDFFISEAANGAFFDKGYNPRT